MTWVLWMVLVTVPHETHTMQALGTFATRGQCEQERTRIGSEMAKAYAREQQDFYFVCRVQKSV